MTLTTLTQGEPWMTPNERNLNQELIRDFARYLETAGVPQSALVTLRVSDIAATWLLARRLESALAPAEGEPAPCPTTAQANAIGRCRDRLRKAIKELEDFCARNGAPTSRGLVDPIHDADQTIKPGSFPTDDATRINPDGDQETERQSAKTADDPNPQQNAPEMPANPKPAIIAAMNTGRPEPTANHQGDRRPFNAPREHRKSKRERRDKYHIRKAARTAPDTRHDSYTAIVVSPGPPPPQDTG